VDAFVGGGGYVQKSERGGRKSEKKEESERIKGNWKVSIFQGEGEGRHTLQIFAD
jgi:hypothetical protein